MLGDFKIILIIFTIIRAPLIIQFFVLLYWLTFDLACLLLTLLTGLIDHPDYWIRIGFRLVIFAVLLVSLRLNQLLIFAFCSFGASFLISLVVIFSLVNLRYFWHNILYYLYYYRDCPKSGFEAIPCSRFMSASSWVKATSFL
jgi:hypothetical protein